MKGKRITKVKLPALAGVYRATTPSGNFYIGRAVNMRHRMLNHYSSAKLGTHPNQWFARSLNKYGHKVKWDVLFYSDNAENALEWERNYLDMFWGDPMLMNQKKGYQFTALENERSKRKPVYAMNLWSGGVIRLNYSGEWGAMVGRSRGAVIPFAVYGQSIEECERKRTEKIADSLSRAANPKPVRPAHSYGKHLYFIWTKRRKWIVWGGEEAKRITSSIEGEYWVKTRTRKWKHKKPATEAIPVRIYRADRGEVLCESMAEACRIIGCSHTDLYKVVYGKQHRLMTKGWRAELVETP